MIDQETLDALKQNAEEIATEVMDKTMDAASKASKGDLSVYGGFFSQIQQKTNS